MKYRKTNQYSSFTLLTFALEHQMSPGVCGWYCDQGLVPVHGINPIEPLSHSSTIITKISLFLHIGFFTLSRTLARMQRILFYNTWNVCGSHLSPWSEKYSLLSLQAFVRDYFSLWVLQTNAFNCRNVVTQKSKQHWKNADAKQIKMMFRPCRKSVMIGNKYVVQHWTMVGAY